MRLPISCHFIHFLLGVGTMLAPDIAVRYAIVYLFVLYQTVQELPTHDVRTWTNDVALFLCGLMTGWLLWGRRPRTR